MDDGFERRWSPAASQEPASDEAPHSVRVKLRAVRDEIDEVDRAIVDLIVRRVGLARRAGRVKHGAGLPIVDPTREAALFRARRGWARERGLSEEAVEAVFRAIVALARASQR